MFAHVIHSLSENIYITLHEKYIFLDNFAIHLSPLLSKQTIKIGIIDQIVAALSKYASIFIHI